MVYKANNYITLGQVFTPQFIVDDMLKLIKNNGNILEPSCGDGAFSKNLKNVVSIEIDKMVCPDYALNIDFFDYSIDNKFDTIIGNPPYVRFKDIQEQTKNKLDMSLFDEKQFIFIFYL